MSASVSQTAGLYSSNSNASPAVTFGSPTTTGKAIYVVAGAWSAGSGTLSCSVTDTAGNTYANAWARHFTLGSGNSISLFGYYCLAAVGNAANTVTMALAGSATIEPTMGALEIAGLGAYDNSISAASASGSNPAPTSLTPATAADFTITVCMTNTNAETFTEPTGFTSKLQLNNFPVSGNNYPCMDIAVQQLASGSALNPTYTITSGAQWICGQALFTVAAAISGGTCPMMGVGFREEPAGQFLSRRGRRLRQRGMAMLPNAA